MGWSATRTRVLEHKLSVLKLLLNLNDDAHHEDRMRRVAQQLDGQIQKLQEAVEVMPLKNHQKCAGWRCCQGVGGFRTAYLCFVELSPRCVRVCVCVCVCVCLSVCVWWWH